MSGRLATVGVALALLLSLAAAASALGWGESAVPYGAGRIAYDCAGGASLAPGSKTEVDWVIWCGPVTGRMRIEIGASKMVGRVTSFTAPRVTGTAGRPVCKVGGKAMNCKLRKTGPVTIRGSFEVPTGACAGKTLVSIPTGDFRDGEGFYKDPWGCPGSRPAHPPKISDIRKFQRQEVLDPGLTGNVPAELDKARRLRQAWIDEAPVERWSLVAWYSPLDASDAELLARRHLATGQAGRLIERWVGAHQARATYAGWTWGPDGSIYVGFTKEPGATVARMKADVSFLEPAWVKPFPVAPRYSENELNALEEKIVEATIELPDREEEKLYGVAEISLDVLANKVRIGAIHVAATRRLMAEKFGPEAPIEVVKGAYAILL